LLLRGGEERRGEERRGEERREEKRREEERRDGTRLFDCRLRLNIYISPGSYHFILTNWFSQIFPL
jgi:hypothetical protein